MAVIQKQSQNQAAAAARDLKQRVLTCLHKLSDRDTHTVATLELEAIAKSLSADTLPSFISSIIATDSSEKSTVRKQCLYLISVLALHHGDLLSPYLSKLLSAVLRRLRDTDSTIRSACVSAVSSIASNLTKPSFSSVSKPFLEALFTEQEANSQIGAAMCLSAVIESAAEPDLALLKKTLVRFEKLVNCEGFKAKASVLVLIGSAVRVGVVAGSMQILGNLVPCLVQVLSSEDWGMRKAAAEALIKLVMVEKEALSNFKAACLKTFEAKKFDKVKAVRDTMNQMVEVWKDVPDPQSNSKVLTENSTDGNYPRGSKSSCTVTSSAPLIRKHQLSKKSPLHDGSVSTTARKSSPLSSADKRKGTPMFRKLDKKNSSDSKMDVSTTGGALIYVDVQKNSCEKAFQKGEIENKLIKTGVKVTAFPKADSRVAPKSTVVFSNQTGDILRSHKESEDLSLIQKQLIQIENQQSSLLDLLQKFMGSSQSGMQSLETRVHGLERALDEISIDLAMSTGKMSNPDSARTTCCNLPGTEFLSSKFWRRTGHLLANSQSDAASVSLVAGSIHTQARARANIYSNPEALKLENKRTRFLGGRGIIVNPLATHDSQKNSEVASIILR